VRNKSKNIHAKWGYSAEIMPLLAHFFKKKGLKGIYSKKTEFIRNSLELKSYTFCPTDRGG